MRLPRARGAAHHFKTQILRLQFEDFQKKPTERLVAAVNNRAIDPALGKPCLGDLRTQSATKTIKNRIGMRLNLVDPALDSRLFDRSTDESVPQRDGGVLALMPISRTDLFAFVVRQQRKVHRARNRPVGKLDGRPHVDPMGLAAGRKKQRRKLGFRNRLHRKCSA